MMKEKSIDSVGQEIKRILWKERKFIDPEYNETQLALDLNLSRRKLRLALSDYFQAWYSRLCNKFRIQEAKRILALPACNSLKIEDIALICGFNNRQTFTFVFDKEVGMSPHKYKMLQDEELQIHTK